MSYDETFRRWQRDPEGFWRELAGAIDWERAPDRILDDSRAPLYAWFPDGVLNTCHNALDRHVEGRRADQPALIYDSAVTQTVRSYSYRQLRDEVARCAGALRGLGIEKGDRVIIYMPMIPEAVVAMLVISASCGIEGARVVAYKPLLDQALGQVSRPPERCVILQRPQLEAELTSGRDVEWAEAMDGAQPVDCVPVAATDPLYILYTSGTTGMPKGIVRDNGGHAVALDWSMDAVYGVAPGEVYWAASDIGWVVGHSYIVYAPLLHGCTTVLYEGKPVGTPDAGAFWRVCADHGVDVLFTAPTANRAIKREDPGAARVADYDLERFRMLFLAGERCDPDTLEWSQKALSRPVIDHWWQTETGWAIAANCVGLEPLPVKPGSPTRAVPGYDVRVLDGDGREAPAGADGA